jgi:hypothetical protein
MPRMSKIGFQAVRDCRAASRYVLETLDKFARFGYYIGLRLTRLIAQEKGSKELKHQTHSGKIIDRWAGITRIVTSLDIKEISPCW